MKTTFYGTLIYDFPNSKIFLRMVLFLIELWFRWHQGEWVDPHGHLGVGEPGQGFRVQQAHIGQRSSTFRTSIQALDLRPSAEVVYIYLSFKKR